MWDVLRFYEDEVEPAPTRKDLDEELSKFSKINFHQFYGFLKEQGLDEFAFFVSRRVQKEKSSMFLSYGCYGSNAEEDELSFCKACICRKMRHDVVKKKL